MDSSPPPSSAAPRGRSLAAVASSLFLAVLCALLLVQDGTDATEAWAGVAVSRAIAHGELGLTERPPGQFVQGPDGRWWLAQDYLAPLLATPAVALAERLPATGLALPHVGVPSGEFERRAAAASVGAWVGALCGALLFLFGVRRLGASPRTALLAALLAVFGTTILPYARTNYDGALSGLLLLGALWFATSPNPRARGLGTGALLGLAVLARFSSAVAALPIALFAALQGAGWKERGRGALRVALAAAPSAAAWLALNQLRTGNPLLPASALPQYALNNALVGPFWTGFFGNLLSPNKGLLFFAPLALLGLVGLAKSRRRGLLASVLVGLLALLLFHAKVRNWSGHWGWGPRYLIPVVPLCLAGLAVLLGRRGWRWAVVAVAVPSLLLQPLAVAANWALRIAVATGNGSADHPFDLRSNQPLDHLRALLDLAGGGCPDLTYLSARCVPDLWWLAWPRSGAGSWPHAVAFALAALVLGALVFAWRSAGRAGGAPEAPAGGASDSDVV